MTTEDPQPQNSHCQAVQALIPTYLSGETKTDDVALIVKHIQACDPCRQLVDTMHGIGHRMATADTIDIPDFSLSVVSQFQAEQALPETQVCCWNTNDISMYVDGQLNDTDAFEAHLPQCPLCCHTVSQMQTLSSTLVQSYYRLEHTLELDLAPAVMNQLHVSTLEAVGCQQYSITVAQTILDDELDPSLAFHVQEHIDGCDECAVWFAKQWSLRHMLAEYTQRLLQQADDHLSPEHTWRYLQPRIKSRGALLRLPQRPAASHWIPIGSTIAAAVLGLTVWFSGAIPLNFNQPQSSPIELTLAALPTMTTFDENDFYNDKAILSGSALATPYPTPESYLFALENEVVPTNPKDATSVALSEPDDMLLDTMWESEKVVFHQ